MHIYFGILFNIRNCVSGTRLKQTIQQEIKLPDSKNILLNLKYSGMQIPY